MPEEKKPLLEVKGLKQYFRVNRNFLVRAGDGTGMLVKIFHPSTDADAVALHIAASDRLRACGLLTPEVLTTAGGARTTSIGCDDGQTALLAGFQIVDGQPLSPDHGYPLRLIGPNRPGVMQTKWLSRIEVHA